jgi:hypothetical protein
MPEPPDYFDRLLTRHVPVAAHRGPVRVRPRLPGPFERAEARWFEPVADDAPAPLVPSAPPAHPAVAPVLPPPVRTERTVIRTEPAPAPERRAAPPATARPDAAPPPRPAADITPARRAAAEAATAPRRHADPVSRPAPPARDEAVAARPARRGAATGPVDPARAAPGMPRAVPAPAARRVAEPREARRPARSEPTVHVRIGRLEVRAAEADRPAAHPARPARDGRHAPAVNLSDYLSGRSPGAAP